MNFNKESYEKLPSEITKSDYNKLDAIQKVYYSEESFHKKKSKEEVNSNIRNNSIRNNSIRNNSIGNNSIGNKKVKKNYKKEINQSEYNNLNETEKELYEYSRSTGIPLISKRKKYYKKIKNIENTLSYRVAHNEKIRLTPNEYNKLGKNAKALGWVKTSNRAGMQSWSNVYRRRYPEDDELDQVLNEKKKIDSEKEKLLKKGKFTKTGYYIHEKLPNYSIQVNRNEYYTLTPNSYDNYIKLDEKLKELNKKRHEIQSRLNKRL